MVGGQGGGNFRGGILISRAAYKKHVGLAFLD